MAYPIDGAFCAALITKSEQSFTSDKSWFRQINPGSDINCILYN